MAVRNRIILVVIRDTEGRDQLRPYRVASEDGIDPLSELQEEQDPGKEVVRYYDVPEGYIIRNIVAVAELGGDQVMGELEDLLVFLVPIAQDLARGRKKK